MKNKKLVLGILTLVIVGIIFILVSALYLNYISEPVRLENETIECVADGGCRVCGCSGEVCVTVERAKEIVTVCVWRPEYECLKATSCRCIEGKCRWEENQAYRECMEAIK